MKIIYSEDKKNAYYDGLKFRRDAKTGYNLYAKPTYQGKREGRVPKNVKLSFHGIADIKPCGKQAVYNMEVDEYHNFAVNGGVIVHNCMDSTRYFIQTTGIYRDKGRTVPELSR